MKSPKTRLKTQYLVQKRKLGLGRYVLKGVREGDGGDEGGEEGAGEGGGVEEGGKDGHFCGGSKRIKDRWRARQEWKGDRLQVEGVRECLLYVHF